MTTTEHPPSSRSAAADGSARTGERWLTLIDQGRCIGCHACTTACKAENQVPVSVTRTFVKNVDVGVFPQVRRAFQVTRCNQCENPPCVAICPTGAMFARADGIVDFDKSSCVGCKACMAACPYDAIFINPEDHSAEKCNLCAHRLDIGLEPACVSVCPAQAILVGTVDDPGSAAARTVAREPVQVRRPEKGTRPKLRYRGATHETLDPLAARAPDGDTFAWAEKPTGARIVPGGSSGRANSSAAAVLSYDVAHRAPWDWRVSLYTWTKSVSAGTYLAAVLLTVLGRAEWDDTFLVWTVPLISTVFLAVTAVLLIADQDHPERFFYVITRGRRGSWLVRGGMALGAFAGLLGLHLLSGLVGWTQLLGLAAVPGTPVAVLVAVYTAYLFAQAKGRDLWQNPLLPVHLLVQAVLAGSASLLLVAPPAVAEEALAATLAGAALTHLALVTGELTMAHPTAHARAAARELTHGRFRRYFWSAQLLIAIGLGAPWASSWGPVVAVAALLGLMAHEHAYVQAGQAVPLA